MSRIVIAVALLTAAPAMPILPAQAAVAAQGQTQCTDTAQKKAKRSMFGSILGGIAGSALGSVGGVGSAVASVAYPATSLLTDELLKMLDCKEQQQAAKATDEAIRGGVGSEVTWTSESRANVPIRIRSTPGGWYGRSDTSTLPRRRSTIPTWRWMARW